MFSPRKVSDIARTKSRRQAGYILLSVMLLMTLMLVALSVELPRVRQQIKRDKEEEMIHRAHEYTGAIRRFYRKFGRYPLNIEQLENTNNLRFLRKRYKDPFTGKDDWRLIHQGEVVLKVGGGTTNLNNSGGFNSGFSQPTPTPTPTPQGSGGISGGGNSGSPSPSGSSGSAFGNPQPGGGPIIGVGGTRKEESIKIIDEKDHYNEWVFYYDPRQEQQQQLIPPGPGPSPSPSPTPRPGG
ncbi:MAG TPA: hypothetical protein VG649_25085 [Candidatus Angelobacter sp.]|nr:hypothetical protein [Candidatus Angelobacter sp.]